MRAAVVIRARDDAKIALRAELHARDGQLAVARRERDTLKAALHRTEHHAAATIERFVDEAAELVTREQRARVEAEDEAHELRARLFDIEVDLDKHRRLLEYLDGRHRRELSRVVQLLREENLEVERLVRVQFGPVRLGALASGKTRGLTANERRVIDALAGN